MNLLRTSILPRTKNQTMAGLETAMNQEVGYLSIDKDGRILVCNELAIGLLREVAHKKHAVLNQVTGRTLKDVLNKPLLETLIGSVLLSKREINALKVTIGGKVYSVTIRLNCLDGEITGCTAYYVPSVNDDTMDDQIFQESLKRIALQLGYPVEEWIEEISGIHAAQLCRCIKNQNHLVRVSSYCPYGQQCPFNPVYGWLELDRRQYLRVHYEEKVRMYIKGFKTAGEIKILNSNKFIEASTVDISLGGLCAMSPSRLVPGVLLEIKFVGTDKGLNGEVVWQSDQNGMHKLGIRFQDLDVECRLFLGRIIASLQRKSQSSGVLKTQVRTEQAHIIAMGILLRLLKTKNEYVFHHCMRTSRISKTIAIALGMPKQDVQTITQAAKIHDLGIMEVESKNIGCGNEWEEIVSHPLRGAEMVGSITGLKPLAPIIRSHHEHFDGTGYPNGLKGNDIPLFSRIIAVADTIDTYISGKSVNEQLRTQLSEAITLEAGRTLDPDIARLCSDLLKRELIFL